MGMGGSEKRKAMFSYVGFLARPVWTATPADADRYLTLQRKGRQLVHSTVRTKALTVIAKPDEHALLDLSDVTGSPLDLHTV